MQVPQKGIKLTEFPIGGYDETTTEIVLSFHLIKSIPSQIAECFQHLRTLNMACNQLTEIPAEIGHLQNLTVLILDHNQLTVLPSELGKLLNLRTLSVSNNQLKELPVSLSSCPKLEELIVSNNRCEWVFPPPIIVENGPTSHILDVLRHFAPSAIVISPSTLHEDFIPAMGQTQFSDISLTSRTSPVPIPCHRLFLRSSPELDRLLQESPSERQLHIDLSDDVLRLLLQFLYTGVIVIPPHVDLDDARKSFSRFGFPDLLNNISAETDTAEDKEIIRRNLNEIWNSQLYPDVVFVVEGVEIPAHKVILACRSETFRREFSGGLVESTLDRIIVEDISEDIFRTMLRYLYSDFFQLEPERAVDMMLLANRYMVPRLQELCERQIDDFVDAENAAGLFELADRVRAAQLRRSCLYYLRTNKEIVMKTIDVDAYLTSDLKQEMEQKEEKNVENFNFNIFSFAESRKRILQHAQSLREKPDTKN
eukprot:TRINITY_DN5373_c0_g1_i1.p1 TRINITY_DN5373_c0_g1~~TRINITY_DN5373_c0_g1_i1.p1  ORF type:complete len:481 (+),score=107.22 TRINITY_DN5373_c0_g1_i1:71-1513(+)